MSNLPLPSEEAQIQSRRLADRIRDEIARAGGWISFSRYMEMALYSPGLGYYGGGARKFGSGGDFVTAPEVTPLFGQALAAQTAQVMQASDSWIVEIGAGTGILAADILQELERLEKLPAQYAILELSGEMRDRQRQTIEQQIPHLAGRITWLQQLPVHFSGVVIANEVLDAMPVQVVVRNEKGWWERGVEWGDDGFRWKDRSVQASLDEVLQTLDLPYCGSGEYVTEVNPAARAWMAAWADALDAGALLAVDYGYPRPEYYSAARAHGTLQCFYRHHAHHDPFFWPGLNDITASVDFTAMAESAFDAGMEIYGYTSQGQFLLNCGILQKLALCGDPGSPGYIRAAKAVEKLTGPHEMGEIFKVLAVGKRIPSSLLGFTTGDRLHRL